MNIVVTRIPRPPRTLGCRTHWAMFRTHSCCLCNDPIYPGMSYVRKVWNKNGSIVVEKWHSGGCPEDERRRMEEYMDKESEVILQAA